MTYITVLNSWKIYTRSKKFCNNFFRISHLMKKPCMMKWKICTCWLGCQQNTSMILKEITLMNAWKIRWVHGHPLVFYFTRFDQITSIRSKKRPNLLVLTVIPSHIIIFMSVSLIYTRDVTLSFFVLVAIKKWLTC